jgi:molybdopterin molybdotransferase
MIKTQSACNDINEPGLIRLDDALARILEASPPIGAYERVNIENARGRTLAETVTAGFDVPRHINSAVDGYALNAADLPAEDPRILEIAGTVYAGEPFGAGSSPANACAS